MTEKTINLKSDRYPIIHEVDKLAEKEQRTLSNMVGVLLSEAIHARNNKDGVNRGKEAPSPIEELGADRRHDVE